MKKAVSCGFIIETPNGFLLCHPTGNEDRWDFPKGRAEEGEPHIDAAIRELFEETGLVLPEYSKHNVLDLGCHPYVREKDLHLFYMRTDDLDVSVMHCESWCENHEGKMIREMDGYKLADINMLWSSLGKSMKKWTEKHFFPVIERSPTIK